MTIFTIGYEGATMPAFLAALKAAGVEQLIDVRMLALSRRPGFSKTPLAAALAEAGIRYVHLQALGTPKPGRDAARKGDRATLKMVYADQLELPEAQAAAARLRALVAAQPSAVMCFCGEAATCHRTLLLAAEGYGAEVVNLSV
ncbi:DUF488 family protein [Sphingomonas sp. 28-63-12]|uniref:DUF488 domain-containing protein n=1 Tax=Sphingomonas sp. 28-63-12 TaxID=1970434 RepID=UPI000BDD985C|nr:MAG: hypothetical protein B7Y47_03645 [Sphingomonas sp. 28-63-12]